MTRVQFYVDQLNDVRNTRCLHQSFRASRICAARLLKACRSEGARPATVKRGRQWKAGDSIVKLGMARQTREPWIWVVGASMGLLINVAAVLVCQLL